MGDIIHFPSQLEFHRRADRDIKLSGLATLLEDIFRVHMTHDNELKDLNKQLRREALKESFKLVSGGR